MQPHRANDPVAVAATVLRAHDDAAVRAIGERLARARSDVRQYLAGATVSQAVKDRDELLRGLAATLGDVSVTEQARIVARTLSRYQTSAWLLERALEDNPHQPGVRATLWAILTARDTPISERQVRRILSGDF